MTTFSYTHPRNILVATLQRFYDEGMAITSGVITFDRLEVAEFTAKCLLLASRIGSFRPIGEKQVEAIIEAFHLPVDEAEAKK